MTKREMAEVLRRAAELMRVGWCQHQNRTVTGEGVLCFCIHGAIVEVCTLKNIGSDCINQIFCEIHRITGCRAIDFNDSPGRTAEEVIKLALDVAACLELEAESEEMET